MALATLFSGGLGPVCVFSALETHDRHAGGAGDCQGSAHGHRCSATLNSLIQGVSRISRSTCKASAETLSAITRNRNVKHQPTSYTL